MAARLTQRYPQADLKDVRVHGERPFRRLCLPGMAGCVGVGARNGGGGHSPRTVPPDPQVANRDAEVIVSRIRGRAPTSMLCLLTDSKR